MADHRSPRRRGALGVVLCLAATVLTLPAPAEAAPRERRSEVAFREARQFAFRQLSRTDARLPAGRYPTVAVGSSFWRTSDTSGWLAGFYPGQLWQAYELSGDRAWARRASGRQRPLAVRQHDGTTHDLGFLLHTSFGRATRLTGDEHAAAVLRRAAATLAGRWVPAVGAIRSWDGPPGEVTVIVDSLVNLELLFAAERLGGESHWHDLAVRHALTVRREHLRPDGSTVHVVRFDEATGRRVWRGTVQGLHDTSTWARGQAWAVYGFTTAWRESRDRRLLDAARRAADFAIAHLPPGAVPVWDYDAPRSEPRDTTAAAVLASGLLELARVDPDRARRTTYDRAARRVLRALVGSRYLARGSGSPALLLHGHHSARYPDAGVTYGDHYLLEALGRVQLLPARTPALPARLSRPTPARVRADLRAVRRVSGVSVRWRGGTARAARFRIATSVDGRSWRVARGGVSSGRVAGFETYDVPDRTVRYVRLTVLGEGAVRELRVRG